jgi:16S rRNA (adenine1518-N6/adenine1519-N6)-dimethyltransferase
MLLRGWIETMADKKLYSPIYIRGLLERHGFRFSKSLGQNFLIDGNIVENICDAGNLSKDDDVLEIGPGIGTLTYELSKRVNKVVAVEIDKSLLPILEETLEDTSNVEIINNDILKMDLKKLFLEHFEKESIKVVANLPYYITTPIIIRLLEENLNLNSIIVMIQKEVAQRMKASPGTKDYGSLSIFVQYYTEPKIAMTVPRTVFIPRPNVDSAVIVLNVKENKIKLDDKDMFFKIVRASFSKRRKTLVNSLSSSGLGLEKDDIKNILSELNIDQNIRAEALSIEDFANISFKIQSLLPPDNIY